MRVEPPWWISALKKKWRNHSFLFPTCEDTKGGCMWTRKRMSTKILTMLAPWLRPPASRIERHKCLLFNPPVYGVLLQQPELVETASSEYVMCCWLHSSQLHRNMWQEVPWKTESSRFEGDVTSLPFQTKLQWSPTCLHPVHWLFFFFFGEEVVNIHLRIFFYWYFERVEGTR